MNCESCGMPMTKKEDFGAQDTKNKYCRYCTDAEGKLKSREEVRKGWIEFAKSTGKTQEESESYVDSQMEKMPAWKK